MRQKKLGRENQYVTLVVGKIITRGQHSPTKATTSQAKFGNIRGSFTFPICDDNRNQKL